MNCNSAKYVYVYMTQKVHISLKKIYSKLRAHSVKTAEWSFKQASTAIQNSLIIIFEQALTSRFVSTWYHTQLNISIVNKVWLYNVLYSQNSIDNYSAWTDTCHLSQVGNWGERVLFAPRSNAFLLIYSCHKTGNIH